MQIIEDFNNSYKQLKKEGKLDRKDLSKNVKLTCSFISFQKIRSDILNKPVKSGDILKMSEITRGQKKITPMTKKLSITRKNIAL